MKCLHCKKEGVAHKLCRSHYNKWYRHNNPLYIKLKGEKKKCLHCGKKSIKRNMCNHHYNKWYRHGDPNY